MAFEQRNLDDYIDVAQRIADFRVAYPDGTLQPLNPAEPWRLVQAEGWEKNGDVITQSFIVYVAAAYRTPEDARPGVGCAWEIFPGRTPYTRGSELQNAETSAWGRAIIAVGASDAKRGIASREEVRNRQAERDDGLSVNRDGSLSRSRTTDEEKAAAGVMTAFQLREHNRLRRYGEPEAGRVIHLPGTPEDDPWTGDPPPGHPVWQSVPQEERPGTADAAQLRRMHKLFADVGITDREARLDHTRTVLGLPGLKSSTRLSYVQAADLIAALEEVKNDAHQG